VTDKLTDSKKPSGRMSHVARSSLLIAFFFAIDKALGLFRQIVIGRQFGVGFELDAFNAANNLPDLLFALISGGALAIAFIPVLTERMQAEGRKALWDLFSRVANLAFLLTGGLALILVFFAPSLVRAELGVAPGFTPELQTLVSDLMRLNLIATLIFSLSGLVSAGLQANQHFLLPAMAPVLYDVGQIFGALVLAPEDPITFAGITLPNAGLGVHGLVYGVILGAFLHLAVQIPGLLRYKFRWTPRLGLDNPAVRKVGRLMAPRILTIGAFQLIFVVQDNLASRLDVGSITALAYGWLIMQVPETIIGTAVGIAILPTLSEHFARQDETAFEASLQRAGRSLIALTLPAAVLLWVTIRPLVEIAFDFDTYGTDLVVWATRAYLIGLAGHSLLEVAARAWYARQNARFPLMATAVSAVTFIALGIILFRPLGAAGIGLSNSLAFTLEAGILIVLLIRLYPGLIRQRNFLLRLIGGCLMVGGLSWALLEFLPLSAIPATLAALAGGGLAVVPFIWQEVKSLVRL
jgi:putative peptidoglycan lipid II flippase